MALARYLRIASLPIQEADEESVVSMGEQPNEEKQLEDLREKIRARRKDSDEITAQLTH